jgi:hypothetical protein
MASAGHTLISPDRLSLRRREGWTSGAEGQALNALWNSRQEDLMETLAKDLGGWTTDELLAEVFVRSAGDRPALQLLQATIVRALLAESDRKFVAGSD